MKKKVIPFTVTILALFICFNIHAQESNSKNSIEPSDEILYFYNKNFVNPSNELLNTLNNTLISNNNKLNVLMEQVKLKTPNLIESQKGEFETEQEFNVRLKSQNELKNELEGIKKEIKKLELITKKLEEDVSSTNSYISKLSQPEALDSKLIEIGSFNINNLSFKIKFKDYYYCIYDMPIPIAKEFKSNFNEPNIYLFPDDFLRFQFNGMIFTLFKDSGFPQSLTFINGKKYRWKRFAMRIWLMEDLDLYIGDGCSIVPFKQDDNTIKLKIEYNQASASKIINLSRFLKLPSYNEWYWLGDDNGFQSSYIGTRKEVDILSNRTSNSLFWSSDFAKPWILSGSLRSTKSYDNTTAGIIPIYYTNAKASNAYLAGNFYKFYVNNYLEPSKNLLNFFQETLTNNPDLLDFRKEKLKNDIMVLENYISQIKPPVLFEEKISSITSLNSTDGTFIVEFKGSSYWVQPWGDSEEFEKKHKELKIYKFPDGLLGFELKGYVYNLYNEDRMSNNITGLDGKKYNYVRIGNQIWMGENLNIELGKGCLCYENNPINCEKYGRLYYQSHSRLKELENAVSFMKGWNIPASSEWKELNDYCGDRYNVYRKLTSRGKTGFNALLGGTYKYPYKFDKIEQYGSYYSSGYGSEVFSTYRSTGNFGQSTSSVHSVRLIRNSRYKSGTF
jgi:uncharacterized protein (TIGR02145 family)